MDTEANKTHQNEVSCSISEQAVWCSSLFTAALQLRLSASPTTNCGEQCEDVIIVDNLKVSCQAVATLSWITERKISDGKQRSLLYNVTVFNQWKNRLIL